MNSDQLWEAPLPSGRGKDRKKKKKKDAKYNMNITWDISTACI